MSSASVAQQFSAGALAMVVHLFFFAALVFGVSWKTLPNLPVYADLWQALPDLPVPIPPEPRPVQEPAPQPKPEPKPAPKPEPVPKPVAKPPPPAPKPVEKAPPKPDIALKEKELERKRLEAQKRLVEEEKRRQEELLKEEQRLVAQRRQEDARKAEEKERLRKAMEKAMAEQLEADLASERDQLEEAQVMAAAAKARDKMILDYRDRIRLKIRGLLRLPLNLKGNPEAVFKVRLLANGEVLSATLVKGSGQQAYDEEVERAILKASPLPLPPDRQAAASFRDGLELKFRPQDL